MKRHLEQVIPVMLIAAERPLHNEWSAAEPVCREQMTHIAEEIAVIQAQHASAWMGRDDSRDALHVVRERAVTRLAELKGVDHAKAEFAVDYALYAVNGIVNQAVGFHLIE